MKTGSATADVFLDEVPIGTGKTVKVTAARGKPQLRVTDGSSTAESKIDVKKSGKQLYVADLEASVPRPPQELAAIAKVALAPGEAATLSIHVEPRAFAFFDAKTNAWVVEPGV